MWAAAGREEGICLPALPARLLMLFVEASEGADRPRAREENRGWGNNSKAGTCDTADSRQGHNFAEYWTHWLANNNLRSGLHGNSVS